MLAARDISLNEFPAHIAHNYRGYSSNIPDRLILAITQLSAMIAEQGTALTG